MTDRERKRWKRRLDKANRIMTRGMNVAMRAELRRVAQEAGRGDWNVERHRKRVESIVARWWLAVAQATRVLVDDMLPEDRSAPAIATRSEAEVERVLSILAAGVVGNSDVAAVVAAMKAQPAVVALIEKAITAAGGNVSQAAAAVAGTPQIATPLVAVVENIAPLAPQPLALPPPPPGPPRLPAPAGPIPPAESWDDLIARQVKEQATQRARKIAAGTQQQVTDALAQAAREGLAEEAAKDRVQEILQGSVSNARARTIARTEINGAQQKAAIIAADAKGKPYKREWLAIDDERTRENHLAADGQVIGPGEKFRVGFSLLDHPGDPNGPAGEVINCRCTMLLLPATG